MATISFTTTFDIINNNVVFTDTTNWSGQGISLSDVNGVFRIVSPSGAVIYNNTDYSNGGCDIWISNALTSQNTIVLPLASNGFPEVGNYVIQYSVFDSNLNVYYTQQNIVNYQYVRPTACIVQRIDCISPLFSSVDSTDYTVNTVAPTISGTHTLDYPYGSAGEGSPTVISFSATGSTIAVSTFYQGTQTTQISADLTYNFVTGVNGFYITDTVTGYKEVKVDCAYICSILCCVRTFNNIKESYRTTNSVKFKEYDDTFQEIMSYLGLIQFSINCGLGDEVCDYLQKVKTLSNCTDACSCGSDNASKVIGLGYLVGPAGPAGAQGAQGTAGDNGNYVTVTAEAAGVNCPNGGQKVILYNGITNAIISTNYICNGSDATVSATRVEVDYNTPFTVAASTDNQAVPDAIITIAADGDYYFAYEADINIDGASSVIVLYRLVKNGTTAINLDREITQGGNLNIVGKIYSNAVASLVAGDVVKLYVDAKTSVTSTILGRSITAIKY